MSAAAAAFATSGMAVAIAADKVDSGKWEYESNCIACHGKDLKGGGVIVDFLTVRPSDLTLLSKSNGGVFPYERVFTSIDGRQFVKGHGSRDMPVWGKDYEIQARQSAEGKSDPERHVRARISALIDYINSMQAK